MALATQDRPPLESKGGANTGWRVCVAAMLLTICAATTFASDRHRPATDRRHGGNPSWVEDHVLLDPITSLDFKDINRGRSLPRASVMSASLTGRNRLQVETPRTSIPEVDATIRRTIPALWQVALSDGASSASLDVRYELISPLGRVNRLGLDSTPGAEIPVRVVPMAPMLSTTRFGETVASGSIELEFDIGRAPRTGTYRGTLMVSVTQL